MTRPVPLQDRKRTYGCMGPLGFSVLLHASKNADQTIAQIAQDQAHTCYLRSQVDKTVRNLYASGLLDKGPRAYSLTTFSITAQGLEKLANPSAFRRAAKRIKTHYQAADEIRETPEPDAMPATPLKPQIAAPYTGQPATPRSNNIWTGGLYSPPQEATSHRPGAMDAHGLPSRWGNQLHHPDGRTTEFTQQGPTP
jgi:hypothetical protein